MGYVPVQVPRDEAYRHFTRRRWWQRRRPMAIPPEDSRKPPFAELIWLPHYYLEFELEARGSTRVTGATLDAWNGVFCLAELTLLEEGTPEGECFAPRIEEEIAIKMARHELMHTIIRARSRGTKPLPKELVRCELLYLPYWIWYFEPRPGTLDIRLLDAVTREVPGQRMKRAALDALAGAHPPS